MSQNFYGVLKGRVLNMVLGREWIWWAVGELSLEGRLVVAQKTPNTRNNVSLYRSHLQLQIKPPYSSPASAAILAAILRTLPWAT